MNIAAVIFSCLFILLVLVDGFEGMILPRRVGRKFRFSLMLYRGLWPLWCALARTIKTPKRRQTFLSIFGPFSLLLLFALWGVLLILAFGILNWSLGTQLQTPAGTVTDIFTYLYLSGVTFFTLGFGDIVPLNHLGRVVVVIEAGIGFGFIAVVIGYMPVLYQAFSKREVSISLLDARAGSPPTAAEILMRFAKSNAMDRLDPFLIEWERWSAELLESTISYPVLAYYRSQHDNQSWLGAATAILDTCAISMAAENGGTNYQARVTFAATRHAIVDICLILGAAPTLSDDDRLADRVCTRLMESLAKAGVKIEPEAGMAKLKKLRGLYEPFLISLAKRLMVTLPPIAHAQTMSDNWQSSAWTKKATGLVQMGRENDHFD